MEKGSYQLPFLLVKGILFLPACCTHRHICAGVFARPAPCALLERETCCKHRVGVSHPKYMILHQLP